MRVPFPHVERPVLVPRPAVILNGSPVGPRGLLIWAAMITNAIRPGWPGDIPIPHSEKLGLLIPSKVRTAKIAALESSTASKFGELDDVTFAKVIAQVRCYLAES